jgi:hypothetical protein
MNQADKPIIHVEAKPDGSFHVGVWACNGSGVGLWQRVTSRKKLRAVLDVAARIRRKMEKEMGSTSP